MKKKAIISITSNQSEDKDDVIEVVTPGYFYINNDCYFTIYDETEISGMAGTTTTLKIFKDKVTLVREGSTEAKMEFEKNKTNVSLYNTPYGGLELKLQTKKLSIDMNEDGGNISIDYNMIVQGQPPLFTTLLINIKTIDISLVK